MLQRSSQVGEFYRMTPPPVWDPKRQLPAQYLDIMIYDEETDQLKHIAFEQALRACGLDAAGLAEMFDWENAVKQVVQPANSTKVDGITELIPSIEDYVNAAKEGYWLPICITIARPFIEHLMMSAVATVSGRDTGATLFGPAGTLGPCTRHCEQQPRAADPAAHPRRPRRALGLQTCRFRPTRRSRRSRVSKRPNEPIHTYPQPQPRVTIDSRYACCLFVRRSLHM